MGRVNKLVTGEAGSEARETLAPLACQSDPRLNAPGRCSVPCHGMGTRGDGGVETRDLDASWRRSAELRW